MRAVVNRIIMALYAKGIIAKGGTEGRGSVPLHTNHQMPGMICPVTA